MKNKYIIEAARIYYKKGTILELTADLDDEYSPKPAGSRFVVDYVDDALNIHGQWMPPQSGSIALIHGVDQFKVVKHG